MTAVSLILVVLAQFPDTFLGEVPTGNGPVDVCVSPGGERAYAAVTWGFAAAIDVNGYQDYSLAGLVPISGEPSAVACDGTGGVLYVADTENSTIHMVNTETLSETGTIQVQGQPVDLVFSPEHSKLFVSHAGGMITVIDGDTGSVEDMFWAGNSLHSLCLSSDGAVIYVPDAESPLESIVNTETGSVSRFTSGMDSRAAAESHNHQRLFLSCTGWDLLAVVNTEDLSVENTIDCGNGAPVELAALTAAPYLYGINQDEAALDVWGTDDLQFKGSVTVPGAPVNLAVHPDGQRVFIVCGDNKMKILGYDPSGVEQAGDSMNLTVTSSPSHSPGFTLSGATGRTVVEARDVTGRVVWERETSIPENTETFTVNGVSPGVLFVRACSGNEVVTGRVLVL